MDNIDACAIFANLYGKNVNPYDVKQDAFWVL